MMALGKHKRSRKKERRIVGKSATSYIVGSKRRESSRM
jgi:hypothetical protein